MRFNDHPVGVLRVYTAQVHEFLEVERKLLASIASQAAVAIENARLQEEAVEKERLERQVQIAAEVQRRMMPAKPPQLPGFDICGLYMCRALNLAAICMILFRWGIVAGDHGRRCGGQGAAGVVADGLGPCCDAGAVPTIFTISTKFPPRQP